MGSHAEVEVPTDENDPFVKRVALCVAVFAVVLALAASGGKTAGGDMMMNQLKSSNEWSRYQAKVQREVLYMQEREDLEQTFGPLNGEEAVELAKLYTAGQKDASKRATDTNERRKQRLGFVTGKLAEYKGEKEELTAHAREFEADRDKAIRRGPFFDTAELLLQIGIVLLSVAMLSKARWAFLAGILVAVGGLALTVMGYFTPDVHIPFISVDTQPQPQ